MKASKHLLFVLWLLMAGKIVAQPTISTQPTNQIVFANSSNTTFSVAVAGTAPCTYQWLLNGTPVPNNIITTVAGKGPPPSYFGNGIAATNAALNNPYGIALDSSGNIFIADTVNNRIRKVDTNGIITTIAGTNLPPGFPGSYSGDEGAATNARLNLPSGVAVDQWGNIYFAEVGNARIRKVDHNGIITTFAGSGINGFLGDGGPATNAEIKGIYGYPFGLCCDAVGNLFLADIGNYSIRKIDTNGVINTVTTGGSRGVVTVDANENIYFSRSDARVYKMDTNGNITAIAGGGSSKLDGGLATNAQIDPYGLCVDTNGNLFIGDLTNGRRGVRKVDTNGIITTVAGNGVAGDQGDGGLATNAALSCPFSIGFDPCGNLIILDQASSNVRKVWLAGWPVLSLNKLTPDFAGNYQVIVTGSSGSVTSSIANLAVSYPPITSQVVTNNNGNRFVINWPVFQPSVFQVQWTTNLIDGSWSNLGSTVIYSGTASGIIGQSDSTWTNDLQRFYRLRWMQ